MTTNRDRVLALRMEGWRASDIARTLQMDRSYVYDLLPPLRPLYLPVELHAAIIEAARADGLTPADYLIAVLEDPDG